MERFARAQVGKPFSQIGMARAKVWPRKTDCCSWYCAELTAAILQVGGLLHQQSNPGAATPSSLYELFAPRAAVTGNPFKLYLLQQQQQHDPENSQMLSINLGGALSKSSKHVSKNLGFDQHSNNRTHFKQLPQRAAHSSGGIQGLTLHSLTSGHGSQR